MRGRLRTIREGTHRPECAEGMGKTVPKFFPCYKIFAYCILSKICAGMGSSIRVPQKWAEFKAIPRAKFLSGPRALNIRVLMIGTPVRYFKHAAHPTE